MMDRLQDCLRVGEVIGRQQAELDDLSAVFSAFLHETVESHREQLGQEIDRLAAAKRRRKPPNTDHLPAVWLPTPLSGRATAQKPVMEVPDPPPLLEAAVAHGGGALGTAAGEVLGQALGGTTGGQLGGVVVGRLLEGAGARLERFLGEHLSPCLPAGPQVFTEDAALPSAPSPFEFPIGEDGLLPGWLYQACGIGSPARRTSEPPAPLPSKMEADPRKTEAEAVDRPKMPAAGLPQMKKVMIRKPKMVPRTAKRGGPAVEAELPEMEIEPALDRLPSVPELSQPELPEAGGSVAPSPPVRLPPLF